MPLDAMVGVSICHRWLGSGQQIAYNMGISASGPQMLSLTRSPFRGRETPVFGAIILPTARDATSKMGEYLLAGNEG